MTKRVVAVVFMLALVLMAGLLAGCGGDGLPGDAVAQVGDEYISQDEFDARMAIFEAQYAFSIPDKETDPEGYKEFQQQVLDFMVMYEVVVQKSESLGISVSDAEVQTEIDSILTESFGVRPGRVRQGLGDQGITLDELKISYKESMLLQKAYDQVTKDVSTVPDADIAAYFEEHKSEYFTEETRTLVTSHLSDRRPAHHHIDHRVRGVHGYHRSVHGYHRGLHDDHRTSHGRGMVDSPHRGPEGACRSRGWRGLAAGGRGLL